MNATVPGEHQPAAPLPQPRSPRYETLTLWRGVACLFIVVYHSIFTGYGLAFDDRGGFWAALFHVCQRLWIGVPFFFVISGYCVTASADALRQREKPAAQFFRRRFRRIYPPYWVWLGLTVVGVWFTDRFLQSGFFAPTHAPPPGALSARQWAGNLTLTHTWSWHLTGGVEFAYLSPSWSLCYEEQFYAIVGLALILARRFFFSALTLITVLVFAGVIFLPALGVRTEGLFYDGYWLMFAAGILVYYVLNYAPRKTLVWFCVPIILGGLYAVAEPRRLLKPEVGEPGQTYLSAFLFALLIIGLHRWDQSVSRSKWLRPFGYCGEMCYSLYLVHWPTVSIVSWAFNRCGIRNPAAVFCFGLPLCVAAAVALARLFHILIERRFLNPNPMKSKITVVEVSRENREGGEGSRKHF